MKELANKFEGQFKCLGGNKEKYKTFSVPIKKEIAKINKDGNKILVNISHKIKFIDIARFMASSLSNLVDKESIKLNVKIVIVFLIMKVLRAI